MVIILAIVVLGLTFVVGSLVMFVLGTRENQSSPPSRAAQTVFVIGILTAFFLAASYWWPFSLFGG
jgi:hypothetical protein